MTGFLVNRQLIGLPHSITLLASLRSPIPFSITNKCYLIQSNKHVWIKKATGLGVTEFMLRYMAWLCLKDDSLRGTQMCIITGPREDLAIGLIDRMKDLITKATYGQNTLK